MTNKAMINKFKEMADMADTSYAMINFNIKETII